MLMPEVDEMSDITDFIYNAVLDAGAKGVVIGLSGGLDSAVVAKLAIDALGKDKVKLIHLPMGLPDKDIFDLVKWLDHEADAIPIIPIFKEFERLFKHLFGRKITRGNLMARIRMTILYGYANEMNLLVAGTTNYSEYMIGYYTKHGDGGVDIEPILHLTKTEVRELAIKLGIPEYITLKKPSAGLWPGQTDEEELGITYEQIDLVLGDYHKAEEDSRFKVDVLHDKSRHKREHPPSLLSDVEYIQE